jgi:hypothetical protein
MTVSVDVEGLLPVFFPGFWDLCAFFERELESPRSDCGCAAVSGEGIKDSLMGGQRKRVKTGAVEKNAGFRKSPSSRKPGNYSGGVLNPNGIPNHSPRLARKGLPWL